MKNLLLILLFLIIQPVSNEQIQLNMGFLQSPVSTYNINNTQKLYAKSAGRNYKTFSANGRTFTVTWYTGYDIFISGVIVLNDDGLGLSGSYPDEASLFAAIYAAIKDYNDKHAPIGAPLCLLPFGLLYLLKKKK